MFPNLGYQIGSILSGRDPDRKGLIKIISTRYFLVIKEIKKISSRYDFDQYFRSGLGLIIAVINVGLRPLWEVQTPDVSIPS
jgi:hypothetical protein